MALIVASWEQVRHELDGVEQALQRLEASIPERVPGAPHFGVACRVAGIVESLQSSVELLKETAP